MRKILLCFFLLCLLENIYACCCFTDLLKPCSSCDYTYVASPCEYTYALSPCEYTYTAVSPCTRSCPKKCNCEAPCSCSKKTCGCDSPCQCQAKICSCGCDSIYFPEVEYPVTVVEMRPYCYKTCWCA